MTPDETDVWGAIYRDQHRGVDAPHCFLRDDGHLDRADTAAHYFVAPRSAAEQQALDLLHGPVLDLGAGPGSYSLYLQDRGLRVTTTDASHGAVEVARARGCRDAYRQDLRRLQLPPDTYGAILIMGNTLGAQQTPETLPTLLDGLRRALRPGGRLVVHMLDPLDTDDPVHLAYHARNRAAGRPVGLATIRVQYRNAVSRWHTLWMPTQEEFEQVAAEAGLAVEHTFAEEPDRVRVLGPVSEAL